VLATSHEPISKVLENPRKYFNSILPWAIFGLMGGFLLIIAQGRLSHGLCFLLIGLGATVNIAKWSRPKKATLPLLACLCFFDLLWYGLPFVSNHKVLVASNDQEIFLATLSLLIYFATLFLGHSLAGSSNRRFVIRDSIIDLSNTLRGNQRLILILLGLGFCAILEWMLFNGSIWIILSRLPQGSLNILTTLLTAVECGSSFVFCFLYAKGEIKRSLFSIFAILISFVLSAKIATILLYSCVTICGSIVIGCYFGRGRFPWFFIVGIVCLLGFLNIGKFEMRENYWRKDMDRVPMYAIPNYFGEWFVASMSRMTLSKNSEYDLEKTDKGQSIFERVSNIQMLLFVNDAISNKEKEILSGETYMVAWKTLVPRVFWPSKPRSHIGQEILNVHFGRQTREETYKTYIAWGLVPESVGNFGPWFGPMILGSVLGFLLGFIERETSYRSLFSIYSILAVFFAITLTNATGLVVSVWLSSMFQMFMVISLSLLPFIQKVRYRTV
jgi:hypothetical protein